eukprot:Phypoly_transcript_02722.p1 GENE.Phypoly_transcript_02722~~Phypoly_transcript_02722.p1  ORF type:complete len:821 (+),score=152.14 Phypoly_transcript_02722:35-2497(+)
MATAQQPGLFTSMVNQLKENSPTQYHNNTKRLGIAPPLEPPTRVLPHTPTDSLGSSPSTGNGHGTGHHENHSPHPLSKSDSMNTPPSRSKLTMSKDPRRIHGYGNMSVSPGGDYIAGPLSPPSALGASPSSYSLSRSGSTEFSPREPQMGISPRAKAPATPQQSHPTSQLPNGGASAPIPITSGGYHPPTVNSYSPVSSPLNPTPLSFSLVKNDVAKDGSSKAGWTAEAIKKHPEILQIMERVRPLGRAAAFGRTYTMAKTPAKDEFLVGRDHLVTLILQHLHYEGLHEAKKILEEETQIKFIDPQLAESRLLNLLRMAVRDTERVWELTLSTSAEAPHLLEELLSDLSLLQEDPTQDADDVNIWDEPEEGNIIYADEKEAREAQTPTSPATAVPLAGDTVSAASAAAGAGGSGEKIRPIKAASLNRLIVLLAQQEKHDIDYMKTFLLTYQSFTKPAKLLQKLIQRYHVPLKPGQSDEDYKKICMVIQLRVVNVIRAWIKDNWADFNDKLLTSLKLFVEGTLRLDNPGLAAVLSQTINGKRGEDDDEKRAKAGPQWNVVPPDPKIPKNIFSLYLDLFDVDEEEIARQMTLIDFEIYESIKMSELLNQSWNKAKLRHRSPNVIRMINRFNDVSHWVVTSILRVEKIRDRARTMAKLVRVGDFLFKLNNFNSAMAVLAGFNNAAVHRLKHTREEMPRNIQQTYDVLQHTLDSNQAYKGYRTLLSNANPPCIPYLGVYLTDLTFIDDGNPDTINGLINFAKRKLVYTVIDKVKQYQQSPYNLQPVYQIASLLVSLVWEHMDEDKQFKISLLREPRNAERSEIL